MLNILTQQLDESTLCNVCGAAMYWIEAEEYDKEFCYHKCSHCSHSVFQQSTRNCHCEACQKQRKRLIKSALKQENIEIKNKGKDKDIIEVQLNQLSLTHKLFLLAILDEQVNEAKSYAEFIDWESIKYHPISPNYLYQKKLLNELIDLNVLVTETAQGDSSRYYLNIKLDGYSQPSLYSVVHQLRLWFYENLSQGVPFEDSDQVKSLIYELLYEKIVQFMQFYCRLFKVQISGSKHLKAFIIQLLDHLAYGQILYLVQTALDYLSQNKLLHAKNEKFINTNLLKKTLEQYRERSLQEKWSTSTLPHPPQLPVTNMAEIFFFKFLGYNELIFVQPVWKLWQKVEPRLRFYAKQSCIYCGSRSLEIQYDANQHVSLYCLDCKHQNHYFIK